MAVSSVTPWPKWFAAVLFLLPAVAALGQSELAKELQGVPDLQPMQLPGRSAGAAVNPETGAVAVVYPEDDCIRLHPGLFDGDVAATAKFTTEDHPAVVAYKKAGDNGYFLARTLSGRTISVLNARTLEVEWEAQVAADLTGGLGIPADPGVPYVYYSVKGDGYDGRMGRINLQTRADEGLFSLERLDGADLYVSGRGNYLYTRHLGLSPTGVNSFRLEEKGAKVTARRLVDRHESTSLYLPDNAERFTAISGGIWDVALQTKFKDLKGQPVAFLGERPYLLTVYDIGPNVEIEAISLNRMEPVGKVSIPWPQQQNGHHIQLENALIRMNAEVLRGPRPAQLLVIKANRAVLVPAGALGPLDEPPLFVDMDTRAIPPGEEAAIGIVKAHPTATLALQDAPKGLELRGESLVWTPTAEQVGPNRIRLKVSDGELESIQTLSLNVEHDSVQLPFEPDAVRLTPDGTRLLLASGQDGQMLPRRNLTQPGDTPRLAVVDLESGKILAHRGSNRFSGFAVDNERVFLAAADADAIRVLKLSDLSDEKTLFTPARPARLVPLGDSLLTLLQGNQDGSLPAKLYSIPDFDSRDAPLALGPPTLGRFGEDLVLRGVVLDAESLRPRGLQSNGPFPLVMTAGQQQRAMSHLQSQMETHFPDPGETVASWPWGVVLRGTILTATDGRQIGQLQFGDQQSHFSGDMNTLLLKRLPVGVALRQRHEHTQGSSRHVSLHAFDLNSGEVRQTIPVTVDTGLPQVSARRLTLLEAGPRILLIIGDRLYSLDTDWLDLPKYPEPLHIASAEMILTLEAGKPAALRSTAGGGTGKITYSVADEMPGLSIDSETGDLTIDPDVFVEAAPHRLANLLSGYGQAVELDRARQRLASAFEQLTGRRTEHFVVAVPADVVAHDEQHRAVIVHRVALLEVPLQPLKDAMPERASQPVADGNAMERRIQELERENAELRRQVELLKELIRGSVGGSGGTTRPAGE